MNDSSTKCECRELLGGRPATATAVVSGAKGCDGAIRSARGKRA